MRNSQRGEIITDVVLVILLAMLFVSAGIWFIGWSLFAWKPFSSEITVYPISCKGEIKKDRCVGQLIFAGPVIYKVFEESQIVVDQNTNRSGMVLPPTKMSTCTVRDKYNWVCESTVLSVTRTMIDGQLIAYWDAELRYVPKWKWWKCKTLGDTECKTGWEKF